MHMQPQVQVLNPLEEPGWDQLVLTHPDHSFFHGAAWARVIHESYGYRPVYFAVRTEGRLLGLLPVMEVDSWLTGRRGVALPFTDECQPLSSPMVDGAKLVREAIEHGRARGWRYFECKGGKELVPEAPASLAYYSHTLDLRLGEDGLFGGLTPAVRRATRKAESRGVRVEMCHTWEAMGTFYRLHCRTRRKHGLPPQPSSFFKNLHRHVIEAGSGFVALARDQGRAVAGAVFVHLGRRAIFKFGASDPGRLDLRGNNAVMWEAMRWLCSRGFESLCLGRTSVANDGLRRFKSGWGGRETRLDFFKYDLTTGQFRQERDQSIGRHTRFFSLVPLSISRLAGELFYRHLG